MALEPETLKNMQIRVAVACVGASALRGSNTGTVKAVRSFFKDLDLRRVSAKNQAEFDGLHNQLIAELCNFLRKKRVSCEFGRCAKALNLFLRDAALNCHLREAYRLHPVESLLHLPIDSKVSEGLVEKFPPETFLRWTGVKYLERNEYTKYQEYAAIYAKNCKIPRICLDDVFYPVAK
jgi:hypothetical protein